MRCKHDTSCISITVARFNCEGIKAITGIDRDRNPCVIHIKEAGYCITCPYQGYCIIVPCRGLLRLVEGIIFIQVNFIMQCSVKVRLTLGYRYRQRQESRCCPHQRRWVLYYLPISRLKHNKPLQGVVYRYRQIQESRCYPHQRSWVLYYLPISRLQHNKPLQGVVALI